MFSRLGRGVARPCCRCSWRRSSTARALSLQAWDDLGPESQVDENASTPHRRTRHAEKAESRLSAAESLAGAAAAAACAVRVDSTLSQESKSSRTFYRRQLPLEHCIPFSSAEGRRIFQEALEEGGLESYFPLSEQFTTQDEPAFCGLAALTMVLNALAIDPGRTWKGPWRWFDESMLECCEPLDVVRDKGICLNKLDCLARCNGAATITKYGDVTGVEEFRADIKRVTCQLPPPEELLIVGYNRKLLGQTGTGHFSPIGGYHSGRDLALIMDVARFKYPPHWVPVPQLWEAMQTVDPETGRSRGYMIVGKDMVSQSLLFTIDRARWEDFHDLAAWLREQARVVPLLLAPTGPADHSKLIPAFLASLPPSVASMVTTYHEALCLKYSDTHMQAIANLLQAIEAHPVYEAMARQSETLLARFREGWSGCCARKVVNERHLLAIMYISVMEWVLRQKSSNGDYRRSDVVCLFPDATFSPALQLEVSQLKRKFSVIVDGGV